MRSICTRSDDDRELAQEEAAVAVARVEFVVGGLDEVAAAVFLYGGRATGDQGVEGVVLVAGRRLVVQVVKRSDAGDKVGQAAIGAWAVSIWESGKRFVRSRSG
jgi:hypothetical protein